MKAKKKAKAFTFKPFSTKQKKLLYWWEEGSPYKDYDIVIADGAIRSGKTIAMICSFLIWSQKHYKGESFIIAGKSIGALKKNVLGPMFQIMQSWGWQYEYNRSENYIIIGSNTYYCYGAVNEASQDLLQGLTAAGALADEVALFPQSFTDQMIGRCSVDGSKIFMNCNPKGPYHYFKLEYINKAKAKKIYYLHFTMDDNLSLANSIKEKFKRMFSGVFFKRYILGLWTMAEGVVYSMFSEEKHVKVLNENWEYIFVSVDYGAQNPTTYGLYGRKDNKYHLIRSYYHSGKDSGQKTNKKYADDMDEFLGEDKKKIKYIIVDPSAKSFIIELREKGYKVIKAKNGVLEGIALLANLLETESFTLDPSCKEDIKEFSSYVWDEKAAERGEDAVLKANDHTADRNRYAVFTDSKLNPFKQRKSISGKGAIS